MATSSLSMLTARVPETRAWRGPVLNNRTIVHGRTPYEDHEESDRRHHLVRLWLRAGDRRRFRG